MIPVMSRLKKKLLLYFILVAVVSLSVSAEIIFEMSSPRFRDAVSAQFREELSKQVPQKRLAAIWEKVDEERVFVPVYDLRDRMILLLIVVSVSIIAAFFLFTKDIVSPMDGMVEATKRIAEGDLTVTVPVKSDDEIGQVGRLINEMNVNLQDMIMQIRQEIRRHMEQIIKASYKAGEIIRDDLADKAVRERKISMKEFRMMQKFAGEVTTILESMSDEMFALQKFVKMYKTYGQQTEILQDDIDRALSRYTSGTQEKEGD